ncbi:HAD family hydrolase [Adhaeribacter radiodurans]|uniref:HAD family phosphatase n=1 Tax=Adhaeribacter radiodurans TaxID=2745197 RepID=A0A7L7LAE5_9BACT|nr:HAD family phosphatase [Adhaeribacter radiodurans]QMU29684.1 HAD family phosphatase [Adhaeribacter radiodurans]
MDLSLVKNIIFDLGGVIINLAYQNSVDALRSLSKKQQAIDFTQQAQSGLFDLYETGQITSEAFRQGLRDTYAIEGEDSALDAAWNAMLLDIPPERIQLLQALGKKFRLFLLSNTNAIHAERFNKTVQEVSGLPGLNSLFEKTYYSHLVGMRKPGAAIFEHILNQNNLTAAETLFIDDSLQHIEGARKLGLQTLHLQPPLTINEFFNHAR